MKIINLSLAFLLFASFVYSGGKVSSHEPCDEELNQIIKEEDKKCKFQRDERKKKRVIDENKTNKILQLVEASATGDVKKMNALLDSGISPDSINKEGYRYYGYSVIGAAVAGSQKEVLRELVRRKANINASMSIRSRSSVLIGAISFSNPHMVSELLKLGADINGQDEHGRSAVILASALAEHYLDGKSKTVLLVIRKWIIENQISIVDEKEIAALDNDDPGSFQRDFAAFKKESIVSETE